jgi:hypothetical protein
MGSSIFGAGYYQGLEEGLEKGLTAGRSEGRGEGALLTLGAGALLAAGTWGYGEIRKRRATRREPRLQKNQTPDSDAGKPGEDGVEG